jgi:uncharacterized protein YdhG (YjbR/CyaY superfamily)
MTNILDTVKPDGWADEESLGVTSKSVTCQFTAYSTNLTDAMMPIYSRETVEALLSQCRKEARREALLEAKQNLETLIKVKELIVHYTNERWHSAFARDWADDAASHYAKKFKELLPELRRMAADASSTLEGEKG